jgi:hypothetical protein
VIGYACSAINKIPGAGGVTPLDASNAGPFWVLSLGLEGISDKP